MLQPLGDPLLVGADAHAAVVRGEHQAHRVRHPIVDHARHGVLDPRRPVTHAEVTLEALRPETLGQGGDLPARHREERRRPADRAVVVRDLVEDRAWRGPPATDVGEVAGQVVQRLRAAVRHDQETDGPANHRAITVRSRT